MTGSTVYLCLILAPLMLGCSDAQSTEDTLQKSGFTDIKTTGWSPFACGEDDTFSTGFRAKNPQGVTVTGTVCCGLLKGCTVRF